MLLETETGMDWVICEQKVNIQRNFGGYDETIFFQGDHDVDQKNLVCKQ